MTVISTRANEKRRDRRREIDLTLEFDGHDFAVGDCSLGGFTIEGGCQFFETGSDVVASLKIPDDEVPACQNITLRVVRNDREAQRVAFRFQDLDDSSFTVLERYLTGRRRP